MNPWFRTGLAALILACLLAISAGGGFASLDRLTQDWRFSSAGLQPTGSTAVVEIDAKSLAEVGVWPWPRHLYAQVLNKLLDAGANQVAFDIDFSSASTEADDAALETALRDAGGFAWLASFVQQGQNGIIAALPLPRFLAQAQPALVNVLLNRQGLATQVLGSVAVGDSVIHALPAALSGKTVEGTSIGVDFGIDAAAVPKLSFADVLDGRFDAKSVSGKDVILGASAVELHDFFQVPRFGIVSGPLLQALATETLKTGRVIHEAGWLPSLLAAALMFGVIVVARRFAGVWVVGVGLLLALVAAELLALLVYRQFGLIVDTALFLVAMPALFALQLAVEVGAQIGHRREAQRRLAYLAIHDAVTGTLSRTGLVEALPLLGPTGSMVLVRLVKLDNVRAALGQDVADAALKLVAVRLAGTAPTLLAYVREDVFALGFAGRAPEPEIGSLIEGVHTISGHAVRLEVALSAAVGPNLGDALLRQAEIALIHGAEENSARSEYAPGQEEAIAYRRMLDIDLREAIGTNGLTIMFQPQVDLADGRVIGAEALVRWTHKTLGAISPADFIPLAEETGAIVELGRWVMVEACRQMHIWNWDGKIGINVSPLQFEYSDVDADVAVALAQSGLSPRRLDIEITEGALVNNPAKVRAVMLALKARGITLSLDDFGTGYSALSSLSVLPFDKIKIDQSFVRRIGKSPADDALLRTIIDLGVRLNKLTVAEGIETAPQSQCLRDWGCAIGQGYLFGKPLNAAAFEALIRPSLKQRA